MNPIAFNFTISQQLRTKPNVAIAVLPIGLMFASFILLFPFSEWLAIILGIPPAAIHGSHSVTPMKDQPNGILWLVIFLVVMVLLMLAGYLLGWSINALVARIFFKWPKEKVNRVFLYSEVPPLWRKDFKGKSGELESSIPSDSAWSKTRQKGKWCFIFNRGVFGWGVPMYVVMACLPAIRGKVEASAFYFCWQAGLWGAAGAFFGLIIWHFSERQFMKQQDKHES